MKFPGGALGARKFHLFLRPLTAPPRRPRGERESDGHEGGNNGTAFHPPSEGGVSPPEAPVFPAFSIFFILKYFYL